MKKFKIVYGAYNYIQEEVLEFDSLEDAEQYAYESAVNIFESYGIFEEHQEYEEENQYLFDEGVERWCSYYAKELRES